MCEADADPLWIQSGAGTLIQCLGCKTFMGFMNELLNHSWIHATSCRKYRKCFYRWNTSSLHSPRFAELSQLLYGVKGSHWSSCGERCHHPGLYGSRWFHTFRSETSWIKSAKLLKNHSNPVPGIKPPNKWSLRTASPFFGTSIECRLSLYVKRNYTGDCS